MAEPNTSGASVVALTIAMLGPVAGPYSLIVMGALAGAMWPLKTMNIATKAQGAWFLLRIVMTAVFISGTAAYLIEEHLKVPAYDALAVASFGIGAIGNGWTKVIAWARDSLLLTRGKRNE